MPWGRGEGATAEESDRRLRARRRALGLQDTPDAALRTCVSRKTDRSDTAAAAGNGASTEGPRSCGHEAQAGANVQPEEAAAPPPRVTGRSEKTNRRCPGDTAEHGSVLPLRPRYRRL